MTQISIKDVVEQCRIYGCDNKVAEILKCPISLVQACRPMIYGQIKNKKHLGIDKETGEYCKITRRYRSDLEEVKIATQQLLIKQLETGHHWLNHERFFNVVANLKPGLGL